MNSIRSGKDISCQVCEKIFYVPLHRLATAKFCSSFCRGKSSQKRFTKTCTICNTPFSFIACREDKAKYCSKHCYYVAQHLKGTVKETCLQCHKIFLSSPSTKRKYCSRKCSWEAKKNTPLGEFQNARKVMKSRNLITQCSICGYNSHPEILGVHHKDSNRKNNSSDNLIVLCPNCHSLEHSKHIPQIGNINLA